MDDHGELLYQPQFATHIEYAKPNHPLESRTIHFEMLVGMLKSERTGRYEPLSIYGKIVQQSNYYERKGRVPPLAVMNLKAENIENRNLLGEDFFGILGNDELRPISTSKKTGIINIHSLHPLERARVVEAVSGAIHKYPLIRTTDQDQLLKMQSKIEGIEGATGQYEKTAKPKYDAQYLYQLYRQGKLANLIPPQMAETDFSQMVDPVTTPEPEGHLPQVIGALDAFDSWDLAQGERNSSETQQTPANPEIPRNPPVPNAEAVAPIVIPDQGPSPLPPPPPPRTSRRGPRR